MNTLSASLTIGFACIGLLACARPPPAAAPAQPVETTSAVLPVAAAPATPRPADEPNDYARVVTSSNRVIEGLTPDLLACYKARLAENPRAHGAITADIVIGSDGRVLRVETTGGAILGPTTMRCIVHRIERATLEPPRGGGTTQIHVPWDFGGEDPGT